MNQTKQKRLHEDLTDSRISILRLLTHLAERGYTNAT